MKPETQSLLTWYDANKLLSFLSASPEIAKLINWDLFAKIMNREIKHQLEEMGLKLF